MDLRGTDGGIADRVYRYQLDVEVPQQAEQSVEPLLVRHTPDQVRPSSIKMSGLEFTECGEKSGTQSSAYDHFECMAWHSTSSSSSRLVTGPFTVGSSQKFTSSEVTGSQMDQGQVIRGGPTRNTISRSPARMQRVGLRIADTVASGHVGA